MKTKHVLQLCIIALLFLGVGCSSESDDNDNNNEIITLFVDEYPTSGTFLLELTSNLEGNVTFSISNQTVSQAVLVNGTELRVGDWLAFDFETYEFFDLEIIASNGSETEDITVKININDVDDIWAFLGSSSRDAYQNANDGDWVLITESEYNDLANYLSETTKSGANDSQLFSNASVTNYTGNRTVANNNGISMPSGSYVFAFKYYSWINNVVSSSIKLSQGDSGGLYEDLGNTLPEHNNEFNHFVLKGSANPTQSESFIGMYASGTIGVKDDAPSSFKWRNGNVDTLDNTASGTVFLHQALSTTLKQWN